MRGRWKRKKEAAIPENLTETGIYYKKLADKYHIAVRIVLVLLAVFVLVTLIAGHRSLKAENFRYMLRSAGLYALSLENPYANISYTADSGTTFALYEDSLAVLAGSGASLYHPSGELLFQADTEGKASVDASGKYMAVYVPGSRTVSLYHSFAEAHTQTLDAPVGIAAVAENGAFAVSVTEGGGAAVYVYDAKFEKAALWKFEGGVVFDLAISPDGKSVAALILSFSSGSYNTELVVKSVKSDQTVVSETFDAKTPVCVEYFSGGGFFAAVNGSISFYRPNGEKVSERTVRSGTFRYSTDGEDLAVLTPSGGLSVYSERGDVKALFSLNGNLFDLDYQGGTVCCSSEKTIYVCHTSNEAVEECPIDAGALDLFVLDDGSILICYASGVRRVIP